MVHALAELPQVRIDYSALRPMEVLLIDDKRLDVMTWVRLEDGSVQVCEVEALFVLDLSTRRVLWVRLVPCLLRADGTRQGITQRMVDTTLTSLLAEHGYPLDYPVQIVHENATAKPSATLGGRLVRATSGQVTLRATGLWDGTATVGGLVQRGGAPRGKAALESFFGHRWDVAFGHVRGQLGSSYQLKHGATDARLREARAVLRQVGDVATDEELTLLMPLEGLPALRQAILDTLHDIESRTGHECQGFDRLHLWRWSQEATWQPMDSPDMRRLLATAGPESVNALLADPSRTMETVESSLHRWDRLRAAQTRWATLAPESLVDLWMDSAEYEYRGDHRVVARLGRGVVHEYRGRAHGLTMGQSCTIRLDPDRPDLGCVLLDARGAVVGRMDYAARTLYGDADGLTQQLKQRAVEWSKTLGVHRGRHQDSAAQASELADRTSVLSTAQARRDAVTGPVHDLSRELAESVQTGCTSSARTQRSAARAERDLSLLTRQAERETASTTRDDELEAALALLT
jgi:hypothetical protein